MADVMGGASSGAGGSGDGDRDMGDGRKGPEQGKIAEVEKEMDAVFAAKKEEDAEKMRATRRAANIIPDRVLNKTGIPGLSREEWMQHCADAALRGQTTAQRYNERMQRLVDVVENTWRDNLGLDVVTPLTPGIESYVNDDSDGTNRRAESPAPPTRGMLDLDSESELEADLSDSEANEGSGLADTGSVARGADSGEEDEYDDEESVDDGAEASRVGHEEGSDDGESADRGAGGGEDEDDGATGTVAEGDGGVEKESEGNETVAYGRKRKAKDAGIGKDD